MAVQTTLGITKFGTNKSTIVSELAHVQPKSDRTKISSSTNQAAMYGCSVKIYQSSPNPSKPHKIEENMTIPPTRVLL